MVIKATFNNEGFPTGFYDTEIHGEKVPDAAVEISANQWEDLIRNPGLRRWDGEKVVGYAPPVIELTPEEKRAAMPNLTARQLRLGLLRLGKLAGVSIAIAALPEPGKSQAEIEWQFASEFRRLHPLIVQLIPILGLTEEEVDLVWEQYSTV